MYVNKITRTLVKNIMTIILELKIDMSSQRLPSIHAACYFQVWISYAQFELSVDGSDNVKRATDVYQQANKTFKQANEKEERLMLLDSWKEFEVYKICRFSVSLLSYCGLQICFRISLRILKGYNMFFQ